MENERAKGSNINSIARMVADELERCLKALNVYRSEQICHFVII